MIEQTRAEPVVNVLRPVDTDRGVIVSSVSR
ncbi:hypothetical protein BKA25_000814 [Actinoalloteichus hymeniacidonis]|nr:hypothetical protein [Actinoalloteichus hymeniacidonis]